jgi:hypothetical protein
MGVSVETGGYLFRVITGGESGPGAGRSIRGQLLEQTAWGEDRDARALVVIWVTCDQSIERLSLGAHHLNCVFVVG